MQKSGITKPIPETGDQKMESKTNAMRMLDKHKTVYQAYSYDSSRALSGIDVATALGQNPKQVFKTLVTVGKSRQHYVFMVPVAEELDLKKAAAAAGEKSVEMVKSKELLGLTGYVHGGCSPLGMKKLFPTFADETACRFSTIIFSAGKIGFQIEAPLTALVEIIGLKTAPLTV